MKLFLLVLNVLTLVAANGAAGPMTSFEETGSGGWPGSDPTLPTDYTVSGYTWTIQRARQLCCTMGGSPVASDGVKGLEIESAGGGWIGTSYLAAGSYTIGFDAKTSSDGVGPEVDIETSTDGSIWTFVQAISVTSTVHTAKSATVSSLVSFKVRIKNPTSVRPVVIDNLMIVPVTLLALNTNSPNNPQRDNREKPIEYLVYDYTGQLLYRSKQLRPGSFSNMPVIVREVYNHRIVTRKIYLKQ